MTSSHTFLSQLRFSVLGLILVTSAQAAVSYINVGDADYYSDEWANILYGDDADPADDYGTGQPESDLVGSMDVPFFYTLYDDSDDDAEGGTLSFRARFAGDEKKYGEYNKNLIIGIAIGDSTHINAFVGVDKHNSVFVLGAPSDSGANTSVSTISIGKTDYDTLDAEVSWRAITDTDVAELADTTLNVDGGTGDASTDYLLSFTISITDLITAAELSEEDLVGNTSLRYLVGTSTNLNNYTQDIGGIDDNSAGGGGADDPYEQPFGDGSGGGGGGGTSGTTQTDGEPILVPEPSTSLMLLLGLLSACGIRRR